MITQLILNNTVYLPYTSRDRYKCYPSELGRSVQMISGRMVTELVGHVQVIEYSYDYMGNDLLRQALAVLRSGQSFPVAYLPDDSDIMTSGTFLTTSITQPSAAFDKRGVLLWHNFGFTLREVSPHD